MLRIKQLCKRIVEFRKAKNRSQSDLAAKVEESYAQISRHKIKDTQPPGKVLKKIVGALDSTTDYLIKDSSEDKTKSSRNDAKLIRYFKEVDALPQEDKSFLLRVVADCIRNAKTKQSCTS